MPNDERALYIISVAADLAGVHPQTLRIYERKGLIEPARTEGRSRRYSERDIVLLRRQETAENGQMVAVRIEDDNSVTLKKFYSEGNRVRLQPANVTMDPIYVDAASVRVQGRVVGVIRSMY